jgi:hypothetical protein
MSNVDPNAKPNFANLQVPAVKKENPNQRTYFARLDGCCYYLKDGTRIRFEGGTYVTDKETEIAELDALLKVPGQYLICDHEVPCLKSDAKILKEVGGGQGGSPVQGPVNSAMIGMVR